ncbi:MAG: Cdc6/Cdc18 family protein [Candidatus Njordarchaeia archaeon]
MSYSIWKDPKSLDHNFVPDRLPRRENERKTVLDDLKQFYSLEEFNSFTSWLIYGSVGSGKTVLSRRISEDLEDKFRENLRTVYVNCRNEKKVYNVLIKMVQSIEPSLPRRGFSREDLINIYVNLLKENSSYGLLILDEIDGLFYSAEGERANDFLYSISRIWEQSKSNSSKLGILIITRDPSILYKWLDDATRASLLKKNLRLNRYGFRDLMEILEYRAELALKSDAYDDEILEMIAKHVSENLKGDMRGNARIALDLLKDSVLIAISEKRNYLIADDVRKAIMRNPNTEPVDDEIFISLGKQRLLLLLALVRAIKKLGGAYVTRMQLMKFYSLVCDEYDEEPRKTTQVLKYLKEIEEETRGAVNVVVSGKGQRGRSTRISLSLPVSDLERKIEKLLNEEVLLNER